ncbi:hypothetical protein PHJA_000481400 [Phtheirospermum japonicum]|uniref:At4g14310 8-bladed propeller domain-containing protein n=1 Tax=Phtheirospermum japonicum TaxID=374723 RepID=A0A830B6U2_9LAMI|nr:hypothetical protein PHJA_000481400 [Phtheirospermum japonicum]
MSTSSARRVKERAASAGKVTPAAGKSMPTGKENPRPTSRVRAATQKPMARTDKTAVEESRADPRVRKSTSSVPRGRSSSPSEFTRVLSDSRNYNSRVSLGPPQKKVNNSFSNELSSGRYNLRNRVSKELEKNVKPEILAVKYIGNGTKEGNFRSVAELSSDIEKNETNLEGNFQENLKSLNLQTSGVGSSSRESKMASKSKYPSKLHEKLAFLEGKVKRIASEIKKTKEMLDSNNPDTSKIILSDIQEKISGIEKAMGVVGPDGDTTMVSVESGEDDGKENEKDLIDSKSLIKGLNVEELEGRLFPHDKLIRDRKLSKTAFGESNVPINVDKGKVVISFDAHLSKRETKAAEVHEGDDAVTYVEESSSMNVLNGGDNIDSLLMADENLDEFDDQGRGPNMMFENEVEESCDYELNDIGSKSSTGGWFVSEGESVLLAHDDGSCSFHDIANSEEKAVYKPPAAISPNMWRDCWLIRAPSADGCSGKYVIAASAGNSLGSGFCSWDFYTKDIRAFHFENEPARVRTALAPLSNNTMYRRNSMAAENRQWWYKPCGPLIVTTASYQKTVQIYDIRDGDRVMKWDLPKPVSGMDYTSPLFWKNRGKVVVAESDGVSLWDVSSLVSQALMSVSSSGGKISALHVNNGDAEIGGGVRQRISSSEAEGNDGVFCTSDSINVLDFRQPSGIALKIPKTGINVQSSFARGDSVYIGCSNSNPSVKKQSTSQIQQFSLRKPRILRTYALPETNAHHHFTALTQVWGNSNLVMGVCGLGLYVFDSLKDDELASFSTGFVPTQNAKEIIGPDDI